MALLVPDIIVAPFALTGTKKVPPQNSATGFVNFQDGYTPFYEISLAANDPNAKPVERAAQNYMFNQATMHAKAWQQMSIAPWYSSMQAQGGYALNAMVIHAASASANANIYRSRVANNITNPLNSPASWELQPFAYQMIENVPMPAGGAGTSTEMQITVAFNANSTLTGTYIVPSDALAAASSNLPFVPGSTAKAGTLEVLKWTYAGNDYTMQRYFDKEGNVFARGAVGTIFVAWDTKYGWSDAQAGAGQYAATTGPANTYAASLVPAALALTNGMEVRLRINVANTGASTFNLNGLGARAIVGQGMMALQGGELVATGQATLRYDSSKASWIIVGAAGGAVQSDTVTGSKQCPNLEQVKSLIFDGGVGQVEWNQVLYKPDVAIRFAANTFSTVDLTGSLDFHYNGDTQDYSTRFASSAIGALQVLGMQGTNASQLFNFARDVNLSNVPLWAGQTLGTIGGLTFGQGAARTPRFNITNNDTTWNFADAAGNILFALFSGANGTRPYFDRRPTFAGATPWDTLNFNPDNKMNLTGNNSSSGLVLDYGGLGPISSLLNNNNGIRNVQLMVRNGNNNSASSVMAFLREGSFGCFMGLDTDNVMKIGGWSFGSASYPILHTGNLATYMPSTTASLSITSIGSYCFMRRWGVEDVTFGRIVSGSVLRYASADDASYDENTVPPGMYRCCGFSAGSGTGKVCTLYQRIS